MGKQLGPEIDWGKVREVYEKLSLAADGYSLSTVMLAFGQLIVHQATASVITGETKFYGQEESK